MVDFLLEKILGEKLSSLEEIVGSEQHKSQLTSKSHNYFFDTSPVTQLSNEVECSYTHFPSIIDIVCEVRTKSNVIERLMALPDYQIADAARAQELMYTSSNKFIKTDTKRSVCERIWDKLTGVRYLGEYKCNDAIRIPIAEIHCPHTNECHTTYIWSSEAEKSTHFTAQVVGASVGGGATIKVTTTESLTSKGQCKLISKLCFVSVDCWQTRAGEIIQVPKIVAIPKGLVSATLPRRVPNHFCTPELEKVQRVMRSFKSNPAYIAHCLPFSLTKSDTAVEKATIRTGLIVDVKSKLSFRALDFPISLDLRVKSTVNNEFSYEISLEGGHDYLGFYRGFDSSAYMWAWKQNGMR